MPGFDSRSLSTSDAKPVATDLFKERRLGQPSLPGCALRSKLDAFRACEAGCPSMKIQHFLRLLFAGALIALIGACATTPTGPAALVGTWTNSLATVWTINPDGTFHAATTTPKAEIWGNYTVAGDTFTVQETRRAGPMPKSCRGPGVYKFSRPDGNSLAFVLVSDKCKPRIQNVTQPWTKK